jgi:predicted secreted hydrolase
LEDWYVEQTPGRTDECHERSEPLCAYRLYAAQSGIILELDLLDQKGPILQGDQGYSQKGAQPGQASYYYSLTRLQLSGNVTVEGQTYQLVGTGWMDHEWSTSVLSQEQVGWDWFSLQFNDGSELMVFQIRRADGRVDPFSSGMLIAADGRTTRLGWEDFSIEVTDRWTSPHSGAIYPARWNLRVPLQRMELAIEPHMADQELNVSYAYWEGAVRATGIKDGSAVKGNGYVELTGYSGSMGGEF